MQLSFENKVEDRKEQLVCKQPSTDVNIFTIETQLRRMYPH